MQLCNRRAARYPRVMSSTKRPLVACLRRRLAACVWLFAFLVLAKGAYATACVVDELSPPVGVAASATADATVHSASPAGDPSAPCWHDGGGCHCACAHATALPPAIRSMHAVIALHIPAVSASLDRAAPPPSSDLRPPIA